ncbi:MAG: TetR family transcriptional regulator [Planctomycetota bacterium]|nr:MAG: TetR family transcriptional regulator [Planctomycetota bacterium]
MMDSKEKRKDAQETCARLLGAASKIFAEKGFLEATVAEICQMAEANIASVNYHFGTKEKLYVESWRYAFNTGLAKYPMEHGFDKAQNAEEKLRAIIQTLVKRISDPESLEFQYINREMANPTGLLREILEKEILPQQLIVKKVLMELLEVNDADKHKQTLKFCHASIISQCLHALKTKTFINNSSGEPHPMFIQNFDEYADHIWEFSLAGIKNIKKKIENEQD